VWKLSDCLDAPRLTLGPLRLRPDDDRLVGVIDEAPAGRDLDAVAAGLEAVEEEPLGDRVLGRRGLDLDPGVEPDVGGAQAFTSRVSTQNATWCRRPWAPSASRV
jgi:hypothetical protein